MQKHNLIIILGILTAIIPFLGIPNLWKTIFFVLAGLAITVSAFSLKRNSTADISKTDDIKNTNSRGNSYIENNIKSNFAENEKGQ